MVVRRWPRFRRSWRFLKRRSARLFRREVAGALASAGLDGLAGCVYDGAVLAVFIGFCEWGLRVWGSYVGGCMSFKPGNIANPKGRAGRGFRMRCGTACASRKKAFVSFVFHFTPFSLGVFQFSIFSCVFAPLR